MILKIKKLKKRVKLPTYSYFGDAGLDVYSLEDKTLMPGELHIFLLGFKMELPKGFVALIWDRGGFGAKGIKSLGGVYDTGYRGEYSITLQNISKKNFSIRKDDRIAQILIQKVEHVKIEQVNELSNSERDKGRFGSSGK